MLANRTLLQSLYKNIIYETKNKVADSNIDNIGDGLDDFMYEYNIKMNLLRKVKYKEIKDQDRYIPKLSSTSLTDRGLYSACYGIIDNNINVYLYTKNEKMKDLQILLHNSKNNTDLYYYIFEEL